MASQQGSGTTKSIVDSHIHLYAASHIPSLNWTGDLAEDHPLNRQNSLDEYRAATGNRSQELRGFVFLETDRKSGLRDTEWQDALEEVDFLVRIARGSPREGEGHRPEDARLVLGIVPWAPVPAGEEGVASYVRQVQVRAGEDAWPLIKGFRYLVQDKPAGTMMQAKFIQGLQWLGRHGLTFDLGVDARSGGMHQLQEACAMMERVYAGGKDGPRIIINHCCKPNLRLSAQEALASNGHSDFAEWKDCIEQMAQHQSTYMKLSGLFSELPEQDETRPTDVAALVEWTRPWVDVVFQAFGPSRIMFGSDWPVCNVGGPGVVKSWSHWHDLVEAILASQNLTAEEQAQIWSGTAIQAYGIQLPGS
ncbi:uncharacterized protein Z520_02050 [Fonsecaea multimorphosa CBS 102226]|uniref:Amidohydrolase-related domain-containing protein n=1 Tax=Fonsecaea multimorphosa CBS 102226 TaxID=1442371 RepID=A0A0D2IY33_9EURO|nr:uncharacterized protein Z520_02050 [Fonsecaea multimorphosa CBS 102226]KIY01912.1 hypothetical protein Z520_02050 [Fonsecaea multimorphosa CBS 102226]OAL29595.1 hypothetical protein AYO22_02009 [Fonsecaea multimorphosa]